MPTIGQLALLLAAIVLFAVGGGLSFARMWADHPKLRLAARIVLGLGIAACAGLLVWHALAKTPRQWLPIGDNFDALIWLATLLSLFVLYVQWHSRLGALDWFVMPIVLLLLIFAAIIGRTEYHAYAVHGVWQWFHRVTSYGGAVLFAIAAAAGAMYWLASRKLRSKAPVGPFFGSLERLEHMTMVSVTLGFALLTLGMVTGGVNWIAAKQHTPPAKLILAVAVWLVYAVVLHAPINPSFRGRKVAMLSVFGFLLMLGTIVTVLLLPGGAS